MSSLRNELNELKSELGVSQENKINNGVTQDLSPDEIRELLVLRQTKYLKSIRYCVVFFTTIFTVSLIASIIYILNNFS